MEGMMRFILIIALIFSGTRVSAQELNCSVQINSAQIANTDQSLFQALQQSVYEFMNQRRWTDDKFSPAERIDCSILITVDQQLSIDEFEATIQVSSSRPVFGTTYSTTVMRYQDEGVRFKYQKFDVLDFSENAYLSELTSLLGYYAYVILAYDYDTFSEMGGQAYWQMAQRVVTNAQPSGPKGWQSFDNRDNRYWLVQNALSNRFESLRKAYYVYHRLGFDELAENVSKGRAKVLEAIKMIEKTHRNEPNSVNQRLFFTAKNQEIVKLFSEAEPAEKNELLNILETIDPANSTKYLAIKEGGR